MGKAVQDRYPEINDGGCCVYASLVGEHLRIRHVPVKIIVSSENGKEVDLDEVRHKIYDPGYKECWNLHGVNFNHVGIEFEYQGKKYHHDTVQTVRRQKILMEWPIYRGYLTVQEAKKLAAESSNWNSCFDRSGIPHIETLIRFHMRAYDFKMRKNQSKTT